MGFKGKITTDATKPDGTPRKLLSATKLRSLGWKPVISLEMGVQATYAWHLEHGAHHRRAVID